MKIVDRATFLAMPEGTVFWKYAPAYFEEMGIKGASLNENDFMVLSLPGDCIDAQDGREWVDRLFEGAETAKSIPMRWDEQGRDGLYEESQLFAVLERHDLTALIATLVLARACSARGVEPLEAAGVGAEA